MDLKFIRKVGKHNLYISSNNLSLIVKKEYKLSSQIILETLHQNADFTHVPHIYQYEIDEEQEKIISYEEYIEGNSIQELLDTCTYITYEQLVLYLDNLLQTLCILHSHNLLHKDIKPGNIVVNNSGAYLIDFDISRQFNNQKETDTSLIGTKGYASPEQFGFAQTTDKSDIYSLGVTLQDILSIVILEPEQYTFFQQLVSEMTVIDSKERPTSIQLLTAFRNYLKQSNGSTTIDSKHSKKEDIADDHIQDTKLLWKWTYLIPFVRTGRGLVLDIVANLFFIIMPTEIIGDPQFIEYYYPVIAVISLLLTLSFMNIFINFITIPMYQKYKINKQFAKRSIVWWLLRLLDYFIYFYFFVFIYNLLSSIT